MTKSKEINKVKKITFEVEVTYNEGTQPIYTQLFANRALRQFNDQVKIMESDGVFGRNSGFPAKCKVKMDSLKQNNE